MFYRVKSKQNTKFIQRPISQAGAVASSFTVKTDLPQINGEPRDVL